MRVFYRTGLTPNAITLLGLVNSIRAYIISQGRMTTGGIVLLLSVLVDALDGTMARLRGESGDFGGSVDRSATVMPNSLPLAAFCIIFSRRADFSGCGPHLPRRLDRCWCPMSKRAQRDWASQPRWASSRALNVTSF